MNTNIKRKMTDALEKIASKNGQHGGWLVCYHGNYPDITFSIYKADKTKGEKTITIQDVNFFIYDGTKESDMMSIAHKIIEDIEEVEL